MATTVQRPDESQPRRWEALCIDHSVGFRGSKPSAINWAEQHVKDEHPGEKVEYP